MHGVTECALDRRENGLTHRSLAVAIPIDPCVLGVVDGPEAPMLDQRSHAHVAEVLA